MDFNATIDLIIKDLDEAREIIDDLKKYPGVPALQVELAKSKCKSAGEVIAMLKSLKDNIAVVKAEPFESQIQSQQQIKSQPSEEKKKSESFVNNQHEEKKLKAVSDESPPHPVVEKEASGDTTENVSETAIIADKFSHLSNRFNEQLGSLKSDDDLSDIMKTKPLANLSDAIGVNDKFLYIREIFDGNNEVYSQAISRLDKAESLADAWAVIMSYTGESNENDAVNQLMDLVKRKLPLNE